MNKLQKLYSIIDNPKELEVKLCDDTLHQTSEREEEIKKEEYPLITEKMQQSIKQYEQRNTAFVSDRQSQMKYI
jgi:hypothetical protein